jgi:hypothetical protein
VTQNISTRGIAKVSQSSPSFTFLLSKTGQIIPVVRGKKRIWRNVHRTRVHSIWPIWAQKTGPEPIVRTTLRAIWRLVPAPFLSLDRAPGRHRNHFCRTWWPSYRHEDFTAKHQNRLILRAKLSLIRSPVESSTDHITLCQHLPQAAHFFKNTRHFMKLGRLCATKRQLLPVAWFQQFPHKLTQQIDAQYLHKLLPRIDL